MRQWAVDPRIMCNQHLLGEHYEAHVIVGALNKGQNVRGFIEHGLLCVANVAHRHDQLVAEMERRGMKHASPLPEIRTDILWRWEAIDRPIDPLWSTEQLLTRCAKCFERMTREVEQADGALKFLYKV